MCHRRARRRQTRALCARLASLSLITLSANSDGGTISLHDVVRDFLREDIGAVRLTHFNHVFVRAIAARLPKAAPHPQAGVTDFAAWWKLPESARYLWDHLIEHFLAADQTVMAEAVASDLRWVRTRIEQSGPAAAYADLAALETPRSARLRSLLSQSAHLLSPTEPAHCRIDILYSRIEHDDYWGPASAPDNPGPATTCTGKPMASS